MHDILSVWERRALLFALQERAAPASLDTLARHLLAWRRGEPAPAPAEDTAIDRLRSELRHEHLLEMDAFGVVAYDPREDEARLADDVSVTVDPPWRDRDSAESIAD